MNGISGQRAAPRLAEPFPARPRCGGKVVTIRSTVVVSSTDDTSRAALPVRARPPAVTASLHTRRRAHTRRAQNPPHPPHPPPPLTSQLKPEAVNASVHPWTDLTWQAWQAWQATTAISDTSPLRASARFTGRVGWGRRRLRRDEVKINSLSRTPGRLSGSPFPFWNTNARSRACNGLARLARINSTPSGQRPSTMYATRPTTSCGNAGRRRNVSPPLVPSLFITSQHLSLSGCLGATGWAALTLLARSLVRTILLLWYGDVTQTGPDGLVSLDLFRLFLEQQSAVACQACGVVGEGPTGEQGETEARWAETTTFLKQHAAHTCTALLHAYACCEAEEVTIAFHRPVPRPPQRAKGLPACQPASLPDCLVTQQLRNRLLQILPMPMHNERIVPPNLSMGPGKAQQGKALAVEEGSGE
ncbi:hypothetical protein DHEL01_v205671 [Diaporthe helianthi]|uniref:Uncharacterized protein n=1 Tax=Diaporthe helianthi TaxID=158607 RepID=A0A2P5I094_DIAHE|nr:hypothetical protein DHEL01_v205671 [Diaporthe helianthi]